MIYSQAGDTGGPRLFPCKRGQRADETCDALRIAAVGSASAVSGYTYSSYGGRRAGYVYGWTLADLWALDRSLILGLGRRLAQTTVQTAEARSARPWIATSYEPERT